MSDNVRDKEVRDKIAEMIDDNSSSLMCRECESDTTCEECQRACADQIIAIFRKEGYIHPDDLVEGWVFQCFLYMEKRCEHCSWADKCSVEGTRPATLQEVLDKKAVPA